MSFNERPIMKRNITLSLRFIALILLSFVPAQGSQEETSITTKTLSRHETLAEFVGIFEHRCRGLTSLCPDKCGHSGNVAQFNIIGYLHYEKSGQYGDPQTGQFTVMIENNMKQLKVSPAIRDIVASLTPGDAVFLSWRHDYITRNGASGPERPITKLEKMVKTSESRQPTSFVPAMGTRPWMDEVNRRAAPEDNDLQRSAIGSPEWMLAKSRKLDVQDEQGHGPDPGSSEWQRAVHKKVFAGEPETVAKVAYQSTEGRYLLAAYNMAWNEVTVTTADGIVRLSETSAASGAKYANSDGKIVFWNKGDSVTFLQDDQLVFEGIALPAIGEPTPQSPNPQ